MDFWKSYAGNKKALFSDMSPWGVLYIFGNDIRHVQNTFHSSECFKTFCKKKAPSVSWKKPNSMSLFCKIMHFTKWKALFSQRCYLLSLLLYNPILHVFSFQWIYFALFLINFTNFWMHFMIIIASKKKCRKIAKSDIVLRIDEICFEKWKSSVILIEPKNWSRIATHLIFFPVKAESPYFSIKKRLLVSYT